MSTLDILTYTEARAALNLDVTGSNARDDILAVYVTGLSALFDEEFGPVVVRTVTDEWHNGGGRFICLREGPVLTLTTLTEYSGTDPQVLTAEAVGTHTSTQYRIDPTRTLVYRRSGGQDSTFSSSGVTITYEAGRYATTATVGERWKLAAQMTLKHNWMAGPGGSGQILDAPGITGTGVPTFTIPQAARALLVGEARIPAVA